ncbi:MAG: hypothetical protein HOQ12_15800 [Gemmatimonadaceae bacterium]|nr:hypothetical protein [Gemmatimonadaceae bacterium]NUR20999.1 hypothetical protein [Gemmatimonadaceae bacterium]
MGKPSHTQHDELDHIVNFLDIMLTPRFRLLFVALALLLGVASLSHGRIADATVVLLLASFLVWGYFRVGSLWLALAAYRLGNVERMRDHVRRVRWPRLLSRRWRGYYHWLQGVALVIDGRVAPARDHLLQARRWRFRTENDRSIMECQLADMAIRCGEPAQAWGHLRHARGLRHHPVVDALIAHVERRIPAEVR